MAMPVNDRGPGKIVTVRAGDKKKVERELPSISEQVKRASGEALKWAVRGFEVVSAEEHERRLTICKDCPEFTGRRCRICGCNMWVKTKLATTECPDGKW